MSRSFFIGVALVGSLMAHQVDKAHAKEPTFHDKITECISITTNVAKAFRPTTAIASRYDSALAEANAAANKCERSVTTGSNDFDVKATTDNIIDWMLNSND